MGRPRLADDVEIAVVYADETPFGGLLSRRLGASVRERCGSVFEHWQRHGGKATIRRSEDVLATAFAGALGELFAGPGQLREDVLYPPAGLIRPTGLVFTRDGSELARTAFTRDLARWIGDFARGELAPADADARALYEQLQGASAFTTDDVDPLPPSDGHFVGHATVAIGDAASGRVLIDPYLLPRSARYPETYQPIVASQLASTLSAVCITHCHPDHYSLGSLLKLGVDTRIFVPHVRRESALAVAMGPRLAELGFERVDELDWHDERAIPGGSITALPFYGEQPTTGARLHPEVRNQGNAYLVELRGKRYVAVADSGTDSAGEAIALAERLRAKGPVDVLFGGYRAFPLYPMEYLDSSVVEYLLFVPPEAWGQRQKIMYDADELIDLAEAWRARHVVPYACGGAPWHWERGLGPVLDVDRPAQQTDPRPEDVVRAAGYRTGSEDDARGSPVDVAILRPGDGFRLSGDALDVVREAPHAWPFTTPADTRWLQFNVTIADGDAHENIWRLFRRIIPAIVELKTTDRARTFFFQRKSPGIRLRVETTHDPQAERALAFELERARSIGAIESYGSAVYEPEWRAFGGRAAMDAVHRYFDADAMLFVDRLALARSTMHGPVCEVVTWLATIADDLAVRCLSERGECADVYASLLDRHGITRDPSAPPLPAELALTHGERDFLGRYQDAAKTLAEAIERLANEGKLLVGRRALVANVIQFSLNRHGLAPREQHAVINVLLRSRER